MSFSTEVILLLFCFEAAGGESFSPLDLLAMDEFRKSSEVFAGAEVVVVPQVRVPTKRHKVCLFFKKNIKFLKGTAVSSDSLLERVASFPSDLTVRTVAGGRNSAVSSETDRDVLCLVLCQDLESCPAVTENAAVVLPETAEVLRGIGHPRYDSRVYLVNLEGDDMVVKEVYSIGRG